MKVTEIEWKIGTGNKWWSGTDSRVYLRIYKDDELLKSLYIEYGDTGHLDKGKTRNYFWKFRRSDLNENGVSISPVGVSHSGYTEPFNINFSNGIEGHLKCVLEIKGKDSWDPIEFKSTIIYGETVFVEGTIDDYDWIERRKVIDFRTNWVMSTERGEGYKKVTLNY